MPVGIILGADGTPLTVVIEGVTYRVPRLDSDGHLQVDPLTLPPDASTETSLAAVLAKLDVALSTRALEAGGNLADILAKLDVALSTRAVEAGGNLAAVLAQLDVALSTRAVESGGNLAAVLAKLDVALSTRAVESGGNLADILTQLNKLTFANSALFSALHGYDGTTWRKLPLLWGYNARVADQQQSIAGGGVNVTLTSASPAAGKVWHVGSVTAENRTSAGIPLLVQWSGGGIIHRLAYVAAPAALQIVGGIVDLTLAAGDVTSAIFTLPVAGDNCNLYVNGYEMTVNA